MKIVFIIISVLTGLALILLLVFGKYSQKGQATGLVNDSLSKCSENPNCVCSEHPDDILHFIEPFTHLKEDKGVDMTKVISVIKDMDGIISSVKDNYISATFSSSIFGFVDDFEIRADPAHGVLHFRSASRVGYSDGGVNQKRVVLFKKLYRDK